MIGWVRGVLCFGTLTTGLIWFAIDAWHGQPIAGLSYFLASLGLVCILAFGFVSWKATLTAWAVSTVAGLASIGTLFLEHPGSNRTIINANISAHNLLVEIASGQGTGQAAKAEVMQRASQMVSDGSCTTQNVRNLGDIAIQLLPAIYLKPELSFLQRFVYGPSVAPVDSCRNQLDELRRMQPEIFPNKKG